MVWWRAAALLAMMLAAPSWAEQPPPKAPSPLEGGETKDRLDHEALAALIRRPAEALSEGDLPRAERKLTALLTRLRSREGSGSLTAADTLSAFAVALYEAEHPLEAATYFHRSADAYKAALGPDHPEVALALHSLADVHLEMTPDKATPELIAIAEEALRIRRLGLGLNNAETGVTYVLLGRVKGLAAGRDPVKVEEAVGLIRFGIDSLPRAPNADATDVPNGYLRLAEVYALNGRTDEALVAAGVYWRMMADIDTFARALRMQTLAETLTRRGDAAGELLHTRYLKDDAALKGLLDAVREAAKAP